MHIKPLPRHLPACSEYLKLKGFILQGRIKTHIKFDDLNRSLFLQARRQDDEGGTNFTAEQARQQLSERNTRKAKKSRHFMSPTSNEADDGAVTNRAAVQGDRGGNSRIDLFDLPSRPASQKWNPPTRESTSESQQME